MHARSEDIYAGKRPEDVPAYALSEAAELVGVAPSTLGFWMRGGTVPSQGGEGHSPAVIRLPVGAGPLLSFTNVVEAHVLSGLRRRHGLQLDAIRTAVRDVHEHLHVEHPLAVEQFKTDGVSLFVEHYGRLIDASREGQLAIREVLDAYLDRIEYGDHRAVRFFPLLREAAPRVIVVDPRRAFGEGSPHVEQDTVRLGLGRAPREQGSPHVERDNVRLGLGWVPLE